MQLNLLLNSFSQVVMKWSCDSSTQVWQQVQVLPRGAGQPAAEERHGEAEGDLLAEDQRDQGQDGKLQGVLARRSADANPVDAAADADGEPLAGAGEAGHLPHQVHSPRRQPLGRTAAATAANSCSTTGKYMNNNHSQCTLTP